MLLDAYMALKLHSMGSDLLSFYRRIKRRSGGKAVVSGGIVVLNKCYMAQLNPCW